MLSPVLLATAGTAAVSPEGDAGGTQPLDLEAVLQAIQGHVRILPAASDGGYQFRRDCLMLEIDFDNFNPMPLIIGIGGEEIPLIIPAGQGRRSVVLLEEDLARNLPLGDWAGRLTVNAIGSERLAFPQPFGPSFRLLAMTRQVTSAGSLSAGREMVSFH